MYGLVLEGGGAKGAYHVGVYKAIKEMDIEIKGVVGTSIGALNGAMIVQDDYDKCYELWKDISYSMIFDIEEEEINKFKELSFSTSDLSFVTERIKRLISDRGLDITPIREMLDKYIDEDKIRNSGKDFGIVTVNVSELKALEMYIEDIPKGDLKKFLLASSYLPFFKLERIGGNIYLDGGFYDNLPFKMLLNKGYEDLIIVRTHAPGFTKKVDIKNADGNIIIISPSEDLGRTYTYEARQARKNIELGYYDGLRVFKGLKGNKYFIETEENKDFAFNYLLNLSEEDVNKMQRILKLNQLPYRRALFEKIIPKLYNMMSLDESSTYEDLLIQLVEIKAKKLNIERFKVYKLQEIISILEEKEIKIKKGNVTVFDRIAEKLDAIYQFNKDEILLAISEIILKKKDN